MAHRADLHRRQHTLDPEEAAYIQAKTVTSLGDWTAYLTNVGLDHFDIEKFVPSAKDAIPGITVPLIAISASGGGQRAGLNGGGMIVRPVLIWASRRVTPPPP